MPGMEVSITNFGGRIVSIMVPDKTGKWLMLFSDLITSAIISMFRVILVHPSDVMQTASIRENNDWRKTIQLPQITSAIAFTAVRRAGSTRFIKCETNRRFLLLKWPVFHPTAIWISPENVEAKVTFKLTNDNAINIDFSATSDQKTVINM